MAGRLAVSLVRIPRSARGGPSAGEPAATSTATFAEARLGGPAVVVGHVAFRQPEPQWECRAVGRGVWMASIRWLPRRGIGYLQAIGRYPGFQNMIRLSNRTAFA